MTKMSASVLATVANNQMAFQGREGLVHSFIALWESKNSSYCFHHRGTSVMLRTLGHGRGPPSTLLWVVLSQKKVDSCVCSLGYTKQPAIVSFANECNKKDDLNSHRLLGLKETSHLYGLLGKVYCHKTLFCQHLISTNT